MTYILELVGPWITRAVGARAGISEATALWAVPIAAFLLAIAVGYLLQAALARAIRGASSTSTQVDDVLVRALRGPTQLVALVVGLAVAILLADLPATIHAWTRALLGVVLGTSIVLFAARLLSGLVETYGERAHLEGPSRRVARRAISLAVWTLGLLLVLQQQGVNVTPLLTTLGLAGLAVALAFQDTLSNLFAGLYIQSDRPLDVGHYVKFEEHGLEGFVVEVGWRTTKIRTLSNNLVVIPNARAANSIVTDYTLPEPRTSLLVRVPVAPDTDAAGVERLILEEAQKAAGTIPGFLKEPAPFVRFIPGYTESGLEFTLICQVESFVDQYAVQHELRHRITQRLRAEGLGTSVPQRTIRIRGEGEEASVSPSRAVKTGDR